MPAFDGRQLTAARALAELTVAELAAAAGVTPRRVHRLEVGGVIQVADKRRHGNVSRTCGTGGSTVWSIQESGEPGAGARWTTRGGARRKADANHLTNRIYQQLVLAA